MPDDGKELTLILNERRLDADSSPRFYETLMRNIGGATSLVIDMSAVVYISSAGLRALLAVQHAMGEEGRVTLRNVNGEVMDILEVTGFSEIFIVESAPGGKQP
ncbi:MAG: STAS domain-containing protein [Fretibacterium sp.]|nr:STAS domain-containing protein [Fretibacterium sp.]